MPVVPDKSKASIRLNGASAELHRAWFQGKVAKFFSFDEAPLAVAGGNVPLSPIYVTFNISPDQPNGSTRFRILHTEPNSPQTRTTCRSRCRNDMGAPPVVVGCGLRQRRFSVGARPGNCAQGQGARSRGGDRQSPVRFHWALSSFSAAYLLLGRPLAGLFLSALAGRT